jgi:uncharacterized membrane protein (GlpM family)
MKINKKLIIGFLISYILSQILIYLVSKSNFFKSPLYILLPVFSYFALYLITPIINKELKINNFLTTIGFILISLIAFYVVLYMFHWNALVLNNIPIKFDYFKIIIDSAFLEFILAGIIGILFSKK